MQPTRSSFIRSKIALGLLAATSLHTQYASALEFDFGGFNVGGSSLITVGAGIRLENPDLNLIYKLNIEGQQELCNADDCLPLSDDAEPSGTFLSAFDAVGGSNYATLSLGAFSNSHRTLYLPDEVTFAPRDNGQFGLGLRSAVTRVAAI